MDLHGWATVTSVAEKALGGSSEAGRTDTFLSTIVQSSAALLAILMGLLVIRLLDQRKERERLDQEQADVLNETIRLQQRQASIEIHRRTNDSPELQTEADHTIPLAIMNLDGRALGVFLTVPLLTRKRQYGPLFALLGTIGIFGIAVPLVVMAYQPDEVSDSSRILLASPFLVLLAALFVYFIWVFLSLTNQDTLPSQVRAKADAKVARSALKARSE